MNAGRDGILLELKEVAVRFGAVKAVDGVSFGVQPGTIHGVIGPNGSGKTTLMNMISGFQSLYSGDIHFKGRSIRSLSVPARARLGIRRSFQHPVTFPDLSVKDNTLVGMHTADDLSWALSCIPLVNQRRERVLEKTAARRLREIGLSSGGRELVRNLPYGQQRLTDLARASAATPKLILLDEPAAGLSDDQLLHLTRYVKTLREQGATVLVTDHNMGFIRGLCDRVTVMNFGRLIAEGVPEAIRVNPDVVEAYLGTGTVEAHHRASVASSDSLVVDGLTAGYAGAAAIADVSVEVRLRETIALVGANGAGKTTTLKTVSGLLAPRAGSVTWKGRRLNGLTPAAVVRAGISHVPQGRGVFDGLTVRDNLLLGAYVLHEAGRAARNQERVEQLFPILRDRSDQLAGSLSGGEQQMLAIGRALMSDPQILMLDEPSLGLAPKVVDRIFSLIDELRESGLGILLVEQNVARALSIADRGHVLSHGRIVLSDSADALANSPSMRKAYLGG